MAETESTLWVELKGEFRINCCWCRGSYEHPFKQGRRVFVQEHYTQEFWQAKVALEYLNWDFNVACPHCGRFALLQLAAKRQWHDRWVAAIFPIVAFGMSILVWVEANVFVYWLGTVVISLLALGYFFCLRQIEKSFPIQGTMSDHNQQPLKPSEHCARRGAYWLVALASLCYAISPAFRLCCDIPLNENCVPLVLSPGKNVTYPLGNLEELKFDRYGGVLVLVAMKEGQTWQPPQVQELLLHAERKRPKDPESTIFKTTFYLSPSNTSQPSVVMVTFLIALPAKGPALPARPPEYALVAKQELKLVCRNLALLDTSIYFGTQLLGFALTCWGSWVVLRSNRRLKGFQTPPEIFIEAVTTDSGKRMIQRSDEL